MAAAGPGPSPITSGIKFGLAADYIPPPSLGHELGVMFGFIGFMVLVSVLYGFGWQVANKRSARRETERIERLQFAAQQEKWREEERAYAGKKANMTAARGRRGSTANEIQTD